MWALYCLRNIIRIMWQQRMSNKIKNSVELRRSIIQILNIVVYTNIYVCTCTCMFTFFIILCSFFFFFFYFLLSIKQQKTYITKDSLKFVGLYALFLFLFSVAFFLILSFTHLRCRSEEEKTNRKSHRLYKTKAVIFIYIRNLVYIHSCV